MAPTDPRSLASVLEQQIHDQLREIERRNLSPSWILLGHEEMYEFKRYVMSWLDRALLSPEPQPLTYRGINVAEVNVKSLCEVVVSVTG